MLKYGFSLLTVGLLACGPNTSVDDPLGPGGKADGVYGNASNAFFAQGVEANIPTAIVTKLTLVLQQDWVEENKSHWWSNTVEDKELRKVFGDSAELSREFADVIGKEDKLRKAYYALREILHNLAAIRFFEDALIEGRYRDVCDGYPSVRMDLLAAYRQVKKGLPPAGATPTVILNIPAEEIQVFYKNERYQRNQVVVGQVDYEGYDQNSKTRVGDHTIKEWHHCYSNADYPSWCDSKSKGAFGEWTAKLDRTYQYLHGTVGNKLLAWFAIKTAPGSHGCVRNQNVDISRMHDLAPEGSFVRKIYARTERTMRIDEDNQDDGWNEANIKIVYLVKKRDNIYDYDTGSYPTALPSALQLPGRPNGVYYPETGVVVGYMHPENAMDSPLSGGTSNACTQRGGTCMDVNQCGGTPVAGLCPGAATIQCCLP